MSSHLSHAPFPFGAFLLGRCVCHWKPLTHPHIPADLSSWDSSAGSSHNPCQTAGAHHPHTVQRSVSWFSIFFQISLKIRLSMPGKSHGQGSLVGCSPWGREESDTTEQLHFHFSLSCIGEGNGNPLQCSCLENPRDGGAWWAAVYGVTQSWIRLRRLSSILYNYVFVYLLYT